MNASFRLGFAVNAVNNPPNPVCGRGNGIILTLRLLIFVNSHRHHHQGKTFSPPLMPHRHGSKKRTGGRAGAGIAAGLRQRGGSGSGSESGSVSADAEQYQFHPDDLMILTREPDHESGALLETHMRGTRSCEPLNASPGSAPAAAIWKAVRAKGQTVFEQIVVVIVVRVRVWRYVALAVTSGRPVQRGRSSIEATSRSPTPSSYCLSSSCLVAITRQRLHANCPMSESDRQPSRPMPNKYRSTRCCRSAG